MKKNSFILIFVLIFVFLFSILALRIYELKSFSSLNIINQYKYLQAKNHLVFLENYINSLENLNLINKIQIDEEKFEIIALINKTETNRYEIEFSVKAIDYNIRVYKKVEIIK